MKSEYDGAISEIVFIFGCLHAGVCEAGVSNRFCCYYGQQSHLQIEYFTFHRKSRGSEEAQRNGIVWEALFCITLL